MASSKPPEPPAKPPAPISANAAMQTKGEKPDKPVVFTDFASI